MHFGQKELIEVHSFRFLSGLVKVQAIGLANFETASRDLLQFSIIDQCHEI